MASGLKILAAVGALAAGAAAIYAVKKHKDLEDYDYEDLDEDFDEDDCCCCGEECDCSDNAEKAEEAAEEAAESAVEPVDVDEAVVEEDIEVPGVEETDEDSTEE